MGTGQEVKKVKKGKQVVREEELKSEGEGAWEVKKIDTKE